VNKNKIKFNFSSCKKIFLTISLSLILCFSPMQKSEAALWPAIDPIYKQALETMYDQLQSVIMGALKQAAVKMINQQVNKLVGGTVGSGAMFITNWESYLVTEPQRQARIFVNAKIDQSLRGRGSYSSYIPRSFGSVMGASNQKNSGKGQVLGVDAEDPNSPTFEGFAQSSGSGNYYGEMQSAAENAVSEEDPQVTFEGNPAEIFSGDTFEPYNSYFSGINNITSASDYFKAVKIEKQQQLETLAQVQSQANNGYLSTMKNGMVITPGATIEQAVANAQDIGNKILAAATRPGEMKMISAIVSQVVTQAIQQGIGTVANMVDRQVNQVEDKALNTLNSKLKDAGPGALYNRR
jgi:hypothetical protein